MTGNRIVAIVGPTATGKTALAVDMAEVLGGEIVNADSMQLYIGMDIGTAKATPAERRDVPHHLLDVWPVSKSAAVAEYQQLARVAIADICARGRVPILVGGSGLYLRGVLDDLTFPGESPEIRSRLIAELEADGPAALHARLAGLDSAAAESILPSNGRRIVRALEVIELTGGPFLAAMPAFTERPDQVQLGLDRADLDERVETRVAAMMATGSARRSARTAAVRPAHEPHGRQGARLCPVAGLSRRRWTGGGRSRRGGERDHAGHPAVRAPPAVVVSPRSTGPLARCGRARANRARARVRPSYSGPVSVTVVKGHATGNDFVVLDDRDGEFELSPELVRALCDRHTGVGADGVLRVVRSALDPAAADHGGAGAVLHGLPQCRRFGGRDVRQRGAAVPALPAVRGPGR